MISKLQQNLFKGQISKTFLFHFKAFIATGFNTVLTFDPTPAFNPAHRQCDYEKEPGKVRNNLNFLLNLGSGEVLPYHIVESEKNL